MVVMVRQWEDTAVELREKDTVVSILILTSPNKITHKPYSTFPIWNF
jgi:hypothetical protein